MLQDVIKDIILEYIGPLKRSTSWSTRNCPLCHTQGESIDTRGRFGIKMPPSGDIAVKCFNCKFTASHIPATMFSKKFKLFLWEIGVPKNVVSKLNFDLYREKNNVRSTAPVVPIVSVTKSWETVELPKDAHPLRTWLDHGCEDPAFLRVLGYLEGRDLLHVDEFYWTPTKDYLMNRRVIIPCRYEGRIVGHVARFVGNEETITVPKYMASVPKGYVYNLDPHLTGERKYIIMAEGAFDAFNVSGIGVLGNGITAEQMSVIRRLQGKIVVIPDQDAPGAALIDLALDEGWAVSFPKWKADIKDASKAVESYGRLATVKMILDAIEDDQLGIRIRYGLQTPLVKKFKKGKKF